MEEKYLEEYLKERKEKIFKYNLIIDDKEFEIDCKRVSAREVEELENGLFEKINQSEEPIDFNDEKTILKAVGVEGFVNFVFDKKIKLIAKSTGLNEELIEEFSKNEIDNLYKFIQSF